MKEYQLLIGCIILSISILFAANLIADSIGGLSSLLAQSFSNMTAVLYEIGKVS